MPGISPEELLAQLDEIIALFLAAPREQNRWVDETNVPAEEMALQFYDTMPFWLNRLQECGLTDEADETALRELFEYVQGVQSQLFIDREHFVGGWYVTDAPEWQRVRELATVALASLRRPNSEKSR
jgi:hypothetical protein